MMTILWIRCWMLCMVMGNSQAFLIQLPTSPTTPLATTATTTTSTRRKQTSLSRLRATLGPDQKTTPQLQLQKQLDDGESWMTLTLLPVLQLTLFSFAVSLLLVQWEDVVCQHALPSRHVTMYLAEAARQKQLAWGQATVRGLGFGRDERLFLEASMPTTATSTTSTPIRSYNEVMLQHRTERVPQWRREAQTPLTSLQYSEAIHTLCDCLANLWVAQDAARNYQWEALSNQLQGAPWTDLAPAANRLRLLNNNNHNHNHNIDNVVGFEWASCAWRGHCHALADAQEALDEIESLSGVLEPYEALFCLDIVERSLREMLQQVPWDSPEYASPADVSFWNNQVPPYRPHRVYDPELEQESSGMESQSIDDKYIEALQELRID